MPSVRVLQGAATTLARAAGFLPSDAGVVVSREDAAWRRVTGTLESAVTAAGNAVRGLLVNEQKTITTSSVVVPATTPLRFANGGRLSVPAGTNFETLAEVEAPPVQIFDPADVSRIRLTRAREVRPEWFGAVPDGVTDCADAVEAAIEATATANGLTGARVVFQRGVYRFSRPLRIRKACMLIGAGVPGVATSNAQAATVLRFPVNSNGIEVWSNTVGSSTQQGSWSVLENLVIEPVTQNGAWGFATGGFNSGTPGPNSSGHGILALTTVHARNIRINGFGGDGIRVDSRTVNQADPSEYINGTYGGNSNLCLFENIRIINCRGCGVHTLGQDTHACVFNRISCATNGREGFLEETFLGINTYIGCDSDANGRWPELSGEGIPLPDYHVPTTAPSNKSTFLGCYIEGDPPRTFPLINGLATAVGGNLPEINRGTGVVFTGDRRSRLRVGRVARGGVWANELVMPDGDESFLRFSPSTDGATAATVTLRVTAGPSGASIAVREKFTTNPATFTPYSGNDPNAPATLDFYSNSAHTLAANEVKDIACTAGVGGAAGNRPGAGTITVTTNAGLASVTNLAAPSGGAAGPELAWALAYRNFADGFWANTGGGRDSVGCYVMRRANDSADVFGWTGLSHPTLKEGQFMLFSPLGDSDHWVTQGQDVSVAAGATTVYEFTGVAAFNRANFFSTHGAARANWHAQATLTPDTEDGELQVLWQRYDSGSSRYRVAVRNTGAVTRAGHVSVLFVARADYK